MKNLILYFNCGSIYETKDAVWFQITKISDINDKIIPFFDKYLIIGIKYNDFILFKEVVELIKSKVHLTEEGLKEIEQINR